MKINILAFGIAREICGTQAFELEVPDNYDTDSLHFLLTDRFPRLHHLASCILAVNQEYIQGNAPIHSGDEIAIIPPVSGG